MGAPPSSKAAGGGGGGGNPATGGFKKSSTSSGHKAGSNAHVRRRCNSTTAADPLVAYCLLPGLTLNKNSRARINHPTMFTYYKLHTSAAVPLNAATLKCKRSRSMPRNSVKQSGFCCCCMVARLLLLLMLLLMQRMRRPRPGCRRRAVMAQAKCNQQRDAEKHNGRKGHCDN